MSNNEYKNLDQFIEEYRYDRDIFLEHYTGIEFKYNDKYFRLSHEYSNNNNSEVFKYYLYEIKDYKNDKISYINIGKYRDLDEVLDNCLIDGNKFKEIITNEKTIILGKD